MSIAIVRRALLRLRAFSFPRRAAALLALAALVGAGACAEKLDSGATCTTLCPLANEQLRDTVFDPVAFDTTLSGFPLLGASRPLLLAVAPAPDSLDVRAVVRFDSVPRKYAPPAGGDSLPITRVDDTFIRLRLDTTGTRPSPLAAPVTIEAYDVDAPNPADTTTATLAALFTPARRIGARTLAASTTLPDSLHLRLSDSAFAAKAQAGARLRIGLRVTSAARAQLRVLGVRAGTAVSATAPTISFDAATDTVYKAVVISPTSATPGGDRTADSVAIDQSLVVRSPRAPNGTDLVVGGTPGQRAFIRFNLPIRLTDSTDVVRATLELTQRPARYASPTDTVRLRSEAVLATTAVTDPLQAALLAAPLGLSADTATRVPTDSGTVRFSIVTLVRAFRTLPANTTRAVALRAPLEGAQAGEVRFFSESAPAAVRPRLRLTYIPRTSFGVP